MEPSDLLAILIAADRVQRSAERDRTFAERVQRSAEICKGLQTGAKSAERGKVCRFSILGMGRKSE
jgi:hypothetical protein